MCPAPIIPMVIMVVNPTSEFLARRYDHRRSSLAHLHSSYGVLRAGGSSNRPGKSAAPLAPVAARRRLGSPEFRPRNHAHDVALAVENRDWSDGLSEPRYCDVTWRRFHRCFLL